MALGALAILLILGAGRAGAKGGKPGAPPAPADTGTIYSMVYDGDPVLYSMNPDGSDRTALGVQGWDPSEPSTAVHGGLRWFLQFRPVGSATYPNGIARRELFAASEDGSFVYQLTDDADLEPSSLDGNEWYRAEPRWAADGSVTDAKVSYLAQRWAQDVNGDWYVAEWGLYVLGIDADDLASHDPSSPTWIPVVFDRAGEGGTRLYAQGYDWAPDGTSFVYKRRGENEGFWRADHDAVSGTWSTVYLLDDDVWNPRWSPSGARLVFTTRFLNGSGGVEISIDSMDPYDPSDRITLIEPPGSSRSVGRTARLPFWSPHETNIAYQLEEWQFKQHRIDYYVYRATADGTDGTKLAPGMLLGWR